MERALVEAPADPELATQLFGTSQPGARRSVNQLDLLDVASLGHSRGGGSLIWREIRSGAQAFGAPGRST
jgi:hypothetical protein